MGWSGRVIGTAAGTIVGGPIGAGVGFLLGSLVDGSSDESSERELDATVRTVRDDVGCWCQVVFPEPLPENAVVVCFVRNPDGSFVKAVPYFADDDGDFLGIAESTGQAYTLYVPNSGLRPQQTEGLHLVVRVIEPSRDGARLYGDAIFEYEMPAKLRWDTVAYHEPILRMLMLVALADGDLDPKSLRAVRECFGQLVKLDASDEQSLVRAMKAARDDTAQYTMVSLVTEATTYCQRRFGDIDLSILSSAMGAVARALGVPTQAAAHVIELCCVALGMDESEWRAVSSEEGLDQDRYYSVLELKPDASFEEVRAAYHRLLKKWHPDLFATRSQSEQDVAAEKTRSICEAYKVIAGGTQ